MEAVATSGRRSTSAITQAATEGRSSGASSGLRGVATPASGCNGGGEGRGSRIFSDGVAEKITGLGRHISALPSVALRQALFSIQMRRCAVAEGSITATLAVKGRLPPVLSSGGLSRTAGAW